ncbi:MAG: alpha/beta hydrolase [Clostridia bacterium]|nr:alpha/beta hydrolase [Clostridia bacterium]
MSYSKTEGTFVSTDGKNNVRYYVYTPENAAPKGVFQISHGMVEHIGRYETEGFIPRMVDMGFVVCGNDHIGHGKTAPTDRDLGVIDDYRDLADDLHILHDIMKKTYPSLPYFLFGHSMGSFVARTFIAKYDDIDGCILSGTTDGGQPLGAGIALASFLCLFGKKNRSKLITGISFGSNNKRFESEGSPTSWLSSDPGVRERKAEDKFSNFSFSVCGYRELFRMIQFVTSDEWIEKVPKSLPIRIISGEFDPLGGDGEGIKSLYRKLCDAEICSLDMYLVKNGRHEPFNDVVKDDFFTKIDVWTSEIIEGVVASRTVG